MTTAVMEREPSTTERDTQTTQSHTDLQTTTRDLRKYVQPTADIYETDDGLVVTLDLPGVSRDGIDLRLDGDRLSIVARNTDAPSDDDSEFLHREFGPTDYLREFRLGDTVDTGRIDAQLIHGVLTVRLPKAIEAKPRKIEVSVGS